MFADRLRSLREKAGISQYRLAKRSGVSKHMVSRLELGTRQPSWETVQRLANALGVDCRSFVDPDLPMPAEETAIRGRGVAALGQTHGLANREEQQAGYAKNAAASAFGDRPASPGEDVDIHIALERELAGLIRWFERNFCHLPREPLQLSEWCKWDDATRFYEDCKAACEAIKRNNTTETAEWLRRYLGQLREHFKGKL